MSWRGPPRPPRSRAPPARRLRRVVCGLVQLGPDRGKDGKPPAVGQALNLGLLRPRRLVETPVSGFARGQELTRWGVTWPSVRQIGGEHSARCQAAVFFL